MLNKRGMSLVGIVLIVGVALSWWLMQSRLQRKTHITGAPKKTEFGTKPDNSDIQFAQKDTQISLKTLTKEQAMQAWWKRREQDKDADWKISIRFYGRVIDEKMQPIAGAQIHFQWTDMSVHGTSEANTASD